MAYIRKRGDAYLISVYIGTDKHGKKQYHYETFRGTKKQAQKRGKELEVQMRHRSPDANMHLDTYLDYWLKKQKNRVSPHAYTVYDWHVRRLKPLVENLKLNNLSVLKLQECLEELNNENLSPKTIKGIYGTLRTALRQAVTWELIEKDIAFGLKTPRVPRKELNVLKPEELVSLLEAARGYKHHLVIRVLAVSGMRLGEVLGLKWKDIDFKTKSLVVQRAADIHSRKLKDEPKTAGSRRTILLDDETTALLKDHFKQTIIRSNIPRINANESLVFSEGDRVLSDGAIRKTMARVLKKAGLPHIRIHDLRHGVASILLEAGYALPLVSLLLGHGSPGTTATIYSHSVRRGVCLTNVLEMGKKMDNVTKLPSKAQ